MQQAEMVRTAMSWTFDDEVLTAERIRTAEDRLRTLLAAIPAARPILAQRPSRVERTRGGEVERLKVAVDAATTAARDSARLRVKALAARRVLDELESLQWNLAMSARTVAHVEARRLRNPLLSHEDLIQEGYIGLLRAAQRFDAERNIRFATYARWWVRAQIIRSIETKGRMVRLPGGAVEMIRKIRTIRQKYAQEGRAVDIETLAHETRLERQRVAELLQLEGSLHGQDVDPDNEDNPIQLHDEKELPDEAIGRQEAFDHVMQFVDSKLDDRERRILEQRYGLVGDDHRTMSDIGDELGISRERVRQIQSAALAYLRSVAFGGASA
jgi:RNA polymerase sigma factor (sigma-70 family)